MTDQSAEFGEHHDGMLHLHSLYSRFESEWQTGPRPQIASILDEVQPSRRAALLELLIPADIRCRQLRGEQPVTADYAAFAEVARDAGLRSLVASAISGDTDAVHRSTDHDASSPTFALLADELLSRPGDSQIVDQDSLPLPADGRDAGELGKQLIESGLPTRFRLNPQVTALLSVVLPGLAAVALVVWWVAPTSPISSVPGAAPARDTDGLPQLTNATVDDVVAWRAEWAKSHGHPVSDELRGVGFLLIPPGRFVMGDDEFGTVQEIPKGFFLSATEITVGQFRDFIQNTAHSTAERGWGWNGDRWELRAGWGWERPGLHDITELHPAASIRYTDAEAYCCWLSEQTGRRVRLPTEAEWEYACRCGRTGLWSFGSDPEVADDYAWTQRQSGHQLHPTAELQPNAWGLYDMHGNESEWCVPGHSDVTASQAVVRGGGFNSVVMETTSASRLIQERTDPSHGAFRIVLEPE